LAAFTDGFDAVAAVLDPDAPEAVLVLVEELHAAAAKARATTGT
jgi:hypothetical protein